MATVRDSILDTVARLRAAGVRATADPADSHPPVVFVRPTRAAPSAAAGCWVVDVEAVLVRGGPATDPLEPWGPRLDTVLDVLGADSVESVPDDTGVEAVVVRSQITT